MTKIKYELADGTTIEVEVTEAQAEVLATMKREQESHERKFKRRTTKETSLDYLYDEYEWEPQDESVNIQAAIERAEDTEQMNRAIDCLTDKQQRVIRLHYYEGLNFAEIAKLMGISKSAVTQHYQAAIKALRKIIKNF